MTTQIAVERFVSLLQRSGIVSEDHLERLRRELADDASGLDCSGKIARQLVEQEVLTSWQADHLLRGKHRGFLLGPYRILKPLGKGGMGQVFLAEHQMMRRRCAVKVLPPKVVENHDRVIERFYREAQAVAALDHKNIVRAYDVNKAMQGSTEIHYLVMEFIDGRDLQKLVEEEGTLDYGRAAHFIRQAAEGLEHAHRAGLVHRDVKPANLLVDGAGVVKVLDLGLARFFNDGDQAALTDRNKMTILGTADYLAPEQAMDSSQVDGRADVYGLGHTFYFLLMGHPPFPKGSVAQRLMAHQMKTPAPITNKRPDAPRELLAIIDKMTAKRPEDRYRSAAEVAEALTAWLLDHAEDDELRRQAALSETGSRPAPPLRCEPTRAAYDPGEETELTLLPLDEERPRRTTAGSDSKKAAPQKKPDASGHAAAVAETDSSAAPSLGAAVDVQQEKIDDPYDFGLSEDLPDLGSAGDGGLASLLEGQGLPRPGTSASDESQSVLTWSSDPGPLGSSGSRKSGPSTYKQGGIATLVRSPLLWVGLVGALIVVGVIVALAVSLSGTDQPLAARIAAVSPSPPGAAPDSVSSASSSNSPNSSSPSTAEPASQKPPAASRPDTPRRPSQAGAGGDGEGPTAPSGASPVPAPGDVPTDVAAATATPSVQRPVEQPRPAPAAVASPSSVRQAVEVAPGPSPPAVAEPAADRRKRLLAGAEYVSLEFVSVDRDPRGKLNLMVRLLATQALERAGLKPASDEPDSAVMRVAIETADAGGLVGIVVSAQLRLRDPTAGTDQESPVVVWERREQLATVAPHLLKRDSVHTIMRQSVAEFFRGFSDDCRAAREGQ